MDEGRDDHLNSPVDDLEAVCIVKSHDVGPHKGEDWHNVVQNFLLNKKNLQSVAFTVSVNCSA